MNKDQMKGAAKEAEGKIQKGAGKMMNSPGNTVEGAAKEAAGKTQKAVGDAKDAAKRKM